MSNLNFVEFERRARMMHDAEVRRLFGLVGHAVAEGARHLARSLHLTHAPGKPGHWA